MADFPAVEIDVDEFGVGRETRCAQKGKHRVGASANHHDYIRFAKRSRARGGKGPRMIFGNDATPLRRREKRYSGGFDETCARPASARDQITPLPVTNEGLARISEKFDGLVHQCGIARRTRIGAILFDPMDFVFVDFAGKDIAGKVEVHWTALAVERLAEGDTDIFGDAIAEIDAIGRLDDRPHHRNLIHLLKGIEGGPAHRRGSADRDHRSRIGPRVRESGDQVGNARTHRRDADAGLAGDARVGVRHHRGGLFMANVDALHARGRGMRRRCRRSVRPS